MGAASYRHEYPRRCSGQNSRRYSWLPSFKGYDIDLYRYEDNESSSKISLYNIGLEKVQRLLQLDQQLSVPPHIRKTFTHAWHSYRR